MFISPVLVLIIVILLVIFLWKSSQSKHKDFPPGPPKLPIWGSYLFMLKENYQHPHLSLQKLSEKYNTDILGIYLGDFPCIVTNNHELCKQALIKEEFLGRNDTIITRLRSLGGRRGIFFTDGQFWIDQRRFSLRNLRDFGFGKRSQAVENFVTDEIKDIISRLSNEPHEEYREIYPEKGVALFPEIIYGPMLSTALHLLVSTRFDQRTLTKIGREALRFQRSGDATGCAISFAPWLRFLAPGYFGYTDACEANEHLVQFMRTALNEHEKTFSEDHLRDLLDIILNERKNMEDVCECEEFSDEQILLVLIDYMFPSAIAQGHTMSFYFALIANHPDIQKKVQEEIDRVVGQSRMPTLDDRKNMPYTEASIREAMRIIPLNPLCIPRRCMKDTYFGGYFVPKDSVVLPNVWAAHYDPKVWTEPEKFQPERFLDKNGQLVKKDLTFSFGGGRRVCAGETFARQNMFLIVSGLLQSFSVEAAYSKFIDLTDIKPGSNLSIENNYIRFSTR